MLSFHPPSIHSLLLIRFRVAGGPGAYPTCHETRGKAPDKSQHQSMKNLIQRDRKSIKTHIHTYQVYIHHSA